MELMVASMVVVVMVMPAMGRRLRRRRKVELWARVGHHERRMGDLIWKYSVNFLRNNKKKLSTHVVATLFLKSVELWVIMKGEWGFLFVFEERSKFTIFVPTQNIILMKYYIRPVVP